MITIYSVMLVALGFLVATLIAFMLAPAYRRRAARLTAESIKLSMPLNEAEIRADKDRLRAEYAILVHDLRTKIEDVSLAVARRNIEVNRRDAVISSLEGEIDRLEVALEEHENARRVLEQTVTDRLPRVEHRLTEAKRLLDQRNREIAQLSQSADTRTRAMEEATQINIQQRDELLRTNAALTSRAARNREALGDPRFEGEVALRSEIEALRAQTREQALLVGRLQALLARAGPANDTQAAGRIPESDPEFARLREDLADAEATLKSVRNAEPGSEPQQPAAEAELRSLKAANRDQATEIVRLKAALASWEGADTSERTLKDSKIALKARLSALQAQADEQTKTIQALRAEAAAANERLARQATQFRDEMRRIGTGTIPVSGPARKEAPQRERRTLSERIQERQSERLATVETAQESNPVARDSTRVSGFLRALSGASEAAPAQRNGALDASTPSEETGREPPAESARKPRLLERLTGLDKSSAS